MKQIELIKVDVSFFVNKRKVEFSVVHNMPEIFGLSFECALDNWFARTKHYTARSLCKYIMSKNTGHVCMTMDQFNQLNSLK